jgi:glycosyltransferase involved in cell wall biosynthesis
MANVALVCSAGLVSGKEIMTLELLSGLHERGFSVDVVTSSWGSAEFRKRCEQNGARTNVMRLGFISATLTWDALRMTAHQMLYWPGLIMTYRRFLQRSPPHRVIHTNWQHLLLLAPFLKTDRDIFWLHEVVPDKSQYRHVFGLLARRIQCFVAVSHAVGNSLAKIGIPKEKIRVVHNGIENPLPDLHLSNPVENEPFRIGIVGQIGVWKGHEDLLEAFRLVTEEGVRAELHVFGSGSVEIETTLKERAKAYGVAENVMWHGFIRDRRMIYQNLSVCVVPSRYEEPLGMTAVEAAFFGIPVIATRKGGLPEVVQDEVTGFLVSSCAPTEIARRLVELASNPHQLRQLGRNARTRAVRDFARTRFLDEFGTLL